MPAPPRLARLPARDLGGVRLARAVGLRARLLGLAGIGRPPAGHALHIPRCRSVHTFGMRFALDLIFLGSRGELLEVARGITPGRFVTCRAARAVIETGAGEADVLLAAWRAGNS